LRDLRDETKIWSVSPALVQKGRDHGYFLIREPDDEGENFGMKESKSEGHWRKPSSERA